MSKTTTIEQRLNERYEQVATDAKATVEKMNNAVRGAYTRLESNGNELFQNLVKAGEKRQKAQSKPQKKTTKAQPSQLDEVRSKVAAALGLPTRDEVEALNKKLTSLTRKVNKLAKDAK
ncbi:poly(hydroxyalkanoate) granule-associated protein [Alcanivorax sp.]|jgi:polyhydroxyalkanoate synthesis regulator phasin|uniref:poly(hydroxyalkanoate) granule-associated protein n=1 Tax=Alcanivorax sp. TaxID=1872427 RepID=UPI0032D8C919